MMLTLRSAALDIAKPLERMECEQSLNVGEVIGRVVCFDVQADGIAPAGTYEEAYDLEYANDRECGGSAKTYRVRRSECDLLNDLESLISSDVTLERNPQSRQTRSMDNWSGYAQSKF